MLLLTVPSGLLLSACMVFSRSSYVVTHCSISFFLWLSGIPVHVCTTSFSNPLSKDPGFLHGLDTLNDAAVNIGVYICL